MNRVERISQGTGHSQLELAKDIGCLETDHQYDWNDKGTIQPWNSVSNLARSLQTDLNSLSWEDNF